MWQHIEAWPLKWVYIGEAPTHPLFQLPNLFTVTLGTGLQCSILLYSNWVMCCRSREGLLAITHFLQSSEIALSLHSQFGKVNSVKVAFSSLTQCG